MIKMLVRLCVFALSLLGHSSVEAVVLPFKVGDQASYTIHQQVEAKHKLGDTSLNTVLHLTVDLNVKLLALNQETLSYPFDIEVVIKNIGFSTVQKEGEETTTARYHPTQGISTVEEHLKNYLDLLIGQPLHLRVNKDFDMEELTELALDSDAGEEVTMTGLLELFSTQLFHLAGQDLLPNQKYPLDNALVMRDEEEDEDEPNDFQGEYTLNKVDSSTIQASWEGHAQVNDELMIADDLHEHMSFEGTVEWDAKHPLIQKRTAHIQVKTAISGPAPLSAKFDVTQTWEPNRTNHMRPGH